MRDTLSPVKRSLAALWSDGRGPILTAVAGGWFLSMGVRTIYPVLLPQIRATYDLGLTSAGLLLTVLFLLYGLGQLPGGMLTDRFGERLILVASTVVSGVTLFVVVSANSVAVLFAATALFGLGLSLYAVARYTLLAEVYPDQLGAANGVASAAADAGNSVLPPIAGLIAAVAAWEFGLGFAIPLFFVAAGVLWVVIPKTSPPAPTTRSVALQETLRSLATGLRQPAVVRGTVVLIIGVSVWQAFTGFYPTYLIEAKGLSPFVASVLFGVFFALGTVIQPLSGGAYDSLGIRKTLTVVMVLFAAAMVVLPFADALWAVAAVTVVSSSLLGLATVTQSYLIVALPEDSQGTGFGLLRTVSFTVGAASPVAFGAVADRGFFDEGFLVLAALSVVVIVVVQATPVTNGP